MHLRKEGALNYNKEKAEIQSWKAESCGPKPGVKFAVNNLLKIFLNFVRQQ